MQELKTKYDLNEVPTDQLVAELVGRNGVSVYNCDLYKQRNYRATISKDFGDHGTIHTPRECDVIVVNRQLVHQDNGEK